MKLPLSLQPEDVLPRDGCAGTLVGRVWLDEAGGPAVVAIRESGVHDISAQAPTMASLLESARPAQAVREMSGPRLGSLQDVLPSLLAPCDLQVVKAAGVTFASQPAGARDRGARGRRPAPRREHPRGGGAGDRRRSARHPPRLARRAGAEGAAGRRRGMWSQYLEVGIGPDAEVFTKAPVLSSVGAGAEIGIHAEVRVEQPGARARAGRQQPRRGGGRHAGQRRQPARLRRPQRAAARPRPRTTTAPAPSAPSSACSTSTFALDDAAARGHRAGGGRRGRLRAARRQHHAPDQPRPAGPGGADARRQPPVPRRLHAVPGHAVRAHAGPRRARAAASPITWATSSPSAAPTWAACGTASTPATGSRPGSFGLRALFNNLAARGLLARAL